MTVSALEEDGSALIRVDGIDTIIGSKGDNTFYSKIRPSSTVHLLVPALSTVRV
ncbi:MAG: hypothetical protein JKY66_05535 [Spongiibacteraceae bacterium]|nr:hypothetical protein [Spongiibacteraceae bacterium]